MNPSLVIPLILVLLTGAVSPAYGQEKEHRDASVSLAVGLHAVESDVSSLSGVGIDWRLTPAFVAEGAGFILTGSGKTSMWLLGLRVESADGRLRPSSGVSLGVVRDSGETLFAVVGKVGARWFALDRVGFELAGSVQMIGNVEGPQPAVGITTGVFLQL